MIEFYPETGRKHQIRLHAAQVLKRPIVGDYKYGPGSSEKIQGMMSKSNVKMMLFLKKLVLKVSLLSLLYDLLI